MSKKLESFFKKRGLMNCSHGIIYNVGAKSEVKFWVHGEESGDSEENILFFDSSEMAQGIWCFKIKDGMVTVV